MPGKVSTHSDVMDRVIDHAISIYPEECCGFLYGVEVDGIVEVKTAKPMHNESTDQRTRRFLITPQEYLEGEKVADKLGSRLLGVFHSHPDHPAVPSKYDLEMAIPGFIYLIVSVSQGVIADTRWWQLCPNRSRFMEMQFISKEVKEVNR